ncbi:FecR family protein [Pedobacter africanus]|uniref:FecR family protein n=1 Tax=Pedobacter africanus TaxID=151894 RepID=UPI001356628E|nr:FecR domain-containing protein [Pedobacter africanus]
MKPRKKRSTYASDVKPGGNKATLTLANGKKISLTDAENSTITEQLGVKITKTANGQLVYTLLGQTDAFNKKLATQFNTIETPTGGQYQINLPDGTSVWLNAASSLKYPVMFDKAQRRVELSGEGYFEVSKDKKRPFVVATAKYEVEVLGTHFNVNSYRDEALSKTTLLEGSVRINAIAKKKETPGSGILLLPGQQAVLSDEANKVLAVDTEEAVAWKNGYFLFNEESLESIMKKIERWYGVDVQYKDKPESIQFMGRVSRSKNISAVLKALETAGNVRFEITGKKVYVTKY